MLTFVINNKSMPVVKIKLSEKQKDIPEMKLTVATRFLGTSNVQSLFLYDCKLKNNGITIFSGIVSELPYPALNDGKIGYTEFICDGQLGRLVIEAGANIHFQDIPVATAITTLFSYLQDSTWAINNSATLTTSNITIDLRQKQTIWSQIRAVLDKCRYPTFLRYSHENGGTYYVDIGYFGDKNREVIVGNNLKKPPKSKPLSKKPIKSLTPISGTSGEQPVDLSLAISADPSLATDASYPIVGNRVMNNTISVGVHVTKTLSIHKTKNDEFPDLTKKQAVAVSLYGECVRELQKGNSRNVIDIEIALNAPPQLNQLIYINQLVNEVIHEDGIEHAVNTFMLQQWIRVVQISTDFKIQGEHDDGINRISQTLYKIKLSTADEIENFDGDKYLIENLAKYDNSDNKNAVSAIQISDVSVPHSATASDCTSGWGDGKLFSLTPPIVASANNVTWTVDVPINRSYTVTQSPDIAGTALIICVSGENNSDWDTDDDLTITATFVFT